MGFLFLLSKKQGIAVYLRSKKVLLLIFLLPLLIVICYFLFKEKKPKQSISKDVKLLQKEIHKIKLEITVMKKDLQALVINYSRDQKKQKNIGKKAYNREIQEAGISGENSFINILREEQQLPFLIPSFVEETIYAAKRQKVKDIKNNAEKNQENLQIKQQIFSKTKQELLTKIKEKQKELKQKTREFNKKLSE